MQLWFELGKLVAGVATPIVVAIVGVLLLRRIEGVKASIAKRSDFQKKWAEEFFVCGQQFMQALEKELALLAALAGLKDPNGEFGSALQKEISRLNPTLSELELRIRRSVVFAPKSGTSVTQAAEKCISLTRELILKRTGNFDAIIDAMNDFNKASRDAHAEMLGLNSV